MRMRKPHLEGKSRTEPFICFHIMFQISFQNFKGQKNDRDVSGVQLEHLASN